MDTWKVLIAAMVTSLAFVACSDSSGEPDARPADACPAEKAENPAEQNCSPEGKECTFGEVCCDGVCYEPESCTCKGGSWICNYTDPCGEAPDAG